MHGPLMGTLLFDMNVELFGPLMGTSDTMLLKAAQRAIRDLHMLEPLDRLRFECGRGIPRVAEIEVKRKWA